MNVILLFIPINYKDSSLGVIKSLYNSASEYRNINPIIILTHADLIETQEEQKLVVNDLSKELNIPTDRIFYVSNYGFDEKNIHQSEERNFKRDIMNMLIFKYALNVAESNARITCINTPYCKVDPVPNPGPGFFEVLIGVAIAVIIVIFTIIIRKMKGYTKPKPKNPKDKKESDESSKSDSDDKDEEKRRKKNDKDKKKNGKNKKHESETPNDDKENLEIEPSKQSETPKEEEKIVVVLKELPIDDRKTNEKS